VTTLTKTARLLYCARRSKKQNTEEIARFSALSRALASQCALAYFPKALARPVRFSVLCLAKALQTPTKKAVPTNPAVSRHGFEG